MSSVTQPFPWFVYATSFDPAAVTLPDAAVFEGRVRRERIVVGTLCKMSSTHTPEMKIVSFIWLDV